MKISSNKLKSLFLLSLVGSNLAKEEKTDNQSELTLNSLPQVGTNFTKREDDKNSILSGSKLSVKTEKVNVDFTAGFAVYKTNPDGSVINQGVLVPAARIIGQTILDCRGFNKAGNAVFTGEENNLIEVGKIDSTIVETNFSYSYMVTSAPWTAIPYVLRKNGQGTIEQSLVTSVSTPSQEGTTVCGYGIKSGYFCGKISSFDWSLEASCTTNTYGLTLVDTGDLAISVGDIGGPIYIENENNGVITSQAVGIIVIGVNQAMTANLVAYMPINNLLAAQGLALMTNNVSTPNGTTSIPTNNTDPTLLFAGYPIVLMEDRNHTHTINCTLGFAVSYNHSPDCSFENNSFSGFLTSSLCSPIADSEDNIVQILSRDGSKHLGDVIYSTLGKHNSIIDIDYALISADQNSLIPYTVGLTNNDKTVSELYLVVGTSLPQLGIICAYGSSSGYHCGNLVGSNLELTIPRANGSNVTFRGLGKIDLGTSGFESMEDIGGPVYSLLNQQGKKTAAQALGYITWIDNSDPNHKLVYYTQLDKALSAIFNNTQCSYSLLTSDDASAKEFQAQVEVPTKK